MKGKTASEPPNNRRSTEADLKMLLDNTTQTFILIDKEHTVVTFNKASQTSAAHHFSGVLEIGASYLSSLNPDVKELLLPRLEEAWGGNVSTSEVTNTRVTGVVDVFEVCYNPARKDEAGNVTHLCIVEQTITARKNEEEKMLTNQRKLDELINNTTDIIWSIDSQMRLISANQAFHKSFEDYFKKKIDEGEPIFFPEWTNSYTKTWKQLYERALKGERYTMEDSTETVLGQVRFHEITFNPIFDDKNNVVGAGCFLRDITERKDIEQKLKYFIEQYDIVSMATNDAIWDWYPSTDTIAWNHGLKTIFGYEEKDIVYSLKWRIDHIHPDDRDRIKAEMDAIFKNKETNYSSTYRFKCSSGVYKYVFDRAYVIYDSEKPVRAIGAVQDIDERMSNLEEVRKLSLVASKTENGVVITDKASRIEWVNNSFTQMTGYTLDEVIGKSSDMFFQSPDVDQEMKKRIKDKIALGQSALEELVNYSKKGQRIWIRHSITPIFNDQGELEKFIFVLSDITAQKHFENRITSIARELADVIEHANTPIFGTDRNGYINEWNKVTAEITGYTKNEAYSKKLLETFIEPDLWPTVSGKLLQAFNGTPVSNYELPIKTKEGDQLTILLSATPRRNSAQEVVGVLMVGQNITELIEYRKNLEKKVKERTSELNEALKKERELVEMKSKFVSMVSHEFRTPLSSISLASGFVRKYKDKLSAEEISVKLDSIEKQVRNMTFLLDDILTIGKSEAGKIKTMLSAIPIRDFFENIIIEVGQSTGATHYVELVADYMQEVIQSDEKLLRNIIINLLTNAIKFSPGQNEVGMNVTCKNNTLTIQVRDNGIGIESDELENIFNAFQRGHNVGTIQGTGLGLSILKKAVDLLHGDIQVKSKPGKGTTFTVTLPLQNEEKNYAG
jgi:PAS domain S-box-containing protein